MTRLDWEIDFNWEDVVLLHLFGLFKPVMYIYIPVVFYLSSGIAK